MTNPSTTKASDQSDYARQVVAYAENSRKADRWRLYLFNRETGERKRALAKHAEMLSRYEARELVKRTKGKLTPPWEYRAERWPMS